MDPFLNSGYFTSLATLQESGTDDSEIERLMRSVPGLQYDFASCDGLFGNDAKEIEWVSGGVRISGCERVQSNDGVAWDGAHFEECS